MTERLLCLWSVYYEQSDKAGGSLTKIGEAETANRINLLVTQSLVMHTNGTISLFRKHVRPQWHDLQYGCHFSISQQTRGTLSDLDGDTVQQQQSNAAMNFFNLFQMAANEELSAAAMISGVSLTREHGCSPVVSVWLSHQQPRCLQQCREELERIFTDADVIIAMVSHDTLPFEKVGGESLPKGLAPMLVLPVTSTSTSNILPSTFLSLIARGRSSSSVLSGFSNDNASTAERSPSFQGGMTLDDGPFGSTAGMFLKGNFESSLFVTPPTSTTKAISSIHADCSLTSFSASVDTGLSSFASQATGGFWVPTTENTVMYPSSSVGGVIGAPQAMQQQQQQQQVMHLVSQGAGGLMFLIPADSNGMPPTPTAAMPQPVQYFVPAPQVAPLTMEVAPPPSPPQPVAGEYSGSLLPAPPPAQPSKAPLPVGVPPPFHTGDVRARSHPLHIPQQSRPRPPPPLGSQHHLPPHEHRQHQQPYYQYGPPQYHNHRFGSVQRPLHIVPQPLASQEWHQPPPKPVSNRPAFVHKGVVYPPGLSRKLYRCIVVHDGDNPTAAAQQQLHQQQQQQLKRQQETKGLGDAQQVNKREEVSSISEDSDDNEGNVVPPAGIAAIGESVVETETADSNNGTTGTTDAVMFADWKRIIQNKGGSFPAPSGYQDGCISTEVYQTLLRERGL